MRMAKTVTKKLTWEVEKTSLVLKVTDGAKETTWRVRKSTKNEDLRQILEEMQLALWIPSWEPISESKPMLETVRTVDAEELAELQRYQPVQANTEEASRAAQARQVAKLTQSAKWFEADEDDSYGMPIPDYDSGEIS